MKVCVVIPAFNEGARLKEVVRRTKKAVRNIPIIVVDDGSEIPIRGIGGVTLLRHQLNLGKGAALKTGAEYAFNAGAGAVIFMDSDGQHDPAELPRFIKLLRKGYGVVFGSRRPSLDSPFIRLVGNKLASIYMNVVFGIYVSDILSGYRALTCQAYRVLKWGSSRYGVETEMVARLGKTGRHLKFMEIPTERIYIDKYKGVTIIDAIKTLISTIWWKLY